MDNITNNKIFFRTIVALGVILSAFLLIKFVNEVKKSSYIGKEFAFQNTINVSGKGEIVTVPDIANFSFSVTEEDKTVVVAQKKATDKTNRAIKFLKDSGIDEKDIKTIGYNVYPKYEYKQVVCNQFGCPPANQTIKGYEVGQEIQVKIRQTDKAGAVLTGIGSLGVRNISGLNFTVDNEEELVKQARALAIKDARDNAKSLARDLGVRLGRVVSFNESGNFPIYFSRFGEGAGKGGDLAIPPQIPSGENKIISNVNIVYEIR